MSKVTPSSSFEEDLDREVQSWKPEKGDKLIGRVLSVEWVDSRYSDEAYPYVELETDDGILYDWHAAQTVARSAVRRKNVRAGDRLAVKCLGDHAKGYRDFGLLVDHGEHSPERTVVAEDNGVSIGEPPEGDE
jgi:hypothetical protein